MSDDEKSQIEEHLTERSTWLRLLFMLLFGFIFWLASMALGIIVLIQFLHVLFSGERNEILSRSSSQLGRYFGEIIDYLTYASDERPFPFSEWPDAPEDKPARNTSTAESRTTAKKTAKKKTAKKTAKKKTSSA